jgi:hypothetical protein
MYEYGFISFRPASRIDEQIAQKSSPFDRRFNDKYANASNWEEPIDGGTLV